MPGANKRAIERMAAIEMDVQARAQAMADEKRAKEQGVARQSELHKSAATIVGVMSAKEKRRLNREQGGRRHGVGL